MGCAKRKWKYSKLNCGLAPSNLRVCVENSTCEAPLKNMPPSLRSDPLTVMLLSLQITYQCHCPRPFKGETCETAIDLCENVTCAGSEECVVDNVSWILQLQLLA